jgi:N-acetylmuramoyl-L-alanine amidase
MIISIHAGHGGADRGTQAGGIDEAAYNFGFSLSLSGMLHRAFAPIVQAVLVRDTDDLVPLSDAGDFAAERNTALAFAVHVNAHPSPNAHGLRIFADAEYPIADHTARRIIQSYPNELRHSRTRDAYLIDDVKLAANPWLHRAWNVVRPYSQNGIPCLLLELFFASNSRDYDYAHQEWVRQQMLLAICQGVAAFAQAISPGTLYDPSTSTLQ